MTTGKTIALTKWTFVGKVILYFLIFCLRSEAFPCKLWKQKDNASSFSFSLFTTLPHLLSSSLSPVQCHQWVGIHAEWHEALSNQCFPSNVDGATQGTHLLCVGMAGASRGWKVGHGELSPPFCSLPLPHNQISGLSVTSVRSRNSTIKRSNLNFKFHVEMIRSMIIVNGMHHHCYKNRLWHDSKSNCNFILELLCLLFLYNLQENNWNKKLVLSSLLTPPLNLLNTITFIVINIIIQEWIKENPNPEVCSQSLFKL